MYNLQNTNTKVNQPHSEGGKRGGGWVGGDDGGDVTYYKILVYTSSFTDVRSST